MWLYNSCYLERKKLASLICHNCDRLFVIIPNIRHSFLLLWWKSTDLLSKCVKWYLNRLFRGLLFKYQKRKKTAVMSLILIKGSTTVKGAVRWSSFVFMFRLKLTGFSWVSQLMFLLLLKLLSEPHCPSSLLCGCFCCHQNQNQNQQLMSATVGPASITTPGSIHRSGPCSDAVRADGQSFPDVQLSMWRWRLFTFPQML